MVRISDLYLADSSLLPTAGKEVIFIQEPMDVDWYIAFYYSSVVLYYLPPHSLLKRGSFWNKLQAEGSSLLISWLDSDSFIYFLLTINNVFSSSILSKVPMYNANLMITEEFKCINYMQGNPLNNFPSG